MSEESKPSPAKRAQRPIDILRERQGGVSKTLTEFVKEQGRVKKAIRAALREGPKTVPQLGATCKAPGQVVLWHVMALRRYGEVVESGMAQRYPLYALKEAR